jgi:hypothetical protein
MNRKCPVLHSASGIALMPADGHDGHARSQPWPSAHRAWMAEHHRTSPLPQGWDLDVGENIALADRPVGIEFTSTGEVYLILGGR